MNGLPTAEEITVLIRLFPTQQQEEPVCVCVYVGWLRQLYPLGRSESDILPHISQGGGRRHGERGGKRNVRGWRERGAGGDEEGVKEEGMIKREREEEGGDREGAGMKEGE